MTEIDESSETIADPRQRLVEIRELGLYERLHLGASQDRCVHFLLVAEFDAQLDAEAVQRASSAVLARHPLLTVGAARRGDGAWVFHRLPSPGPAPVRVVDDPAATWQREAVDELHHPFDTRSGPRLRLTLVRRGHRCALLLALDHTIADGGSGVHLLSDLVAALNGHPLPPLDVLPSAETLMANAFGNPPQPNPAAEDLDARLSAPPRSIRHRGSAQSLATLEMDSVDTAALARRCRAERTTVHAAIVVATSWVRATDTGHDYLRTASPISLRALLDVGEDCGLFVSQAVTGIATTNDDSQFWHRARELSARLTAARAPEAIHAVTQAMHRAAPTTLDDLQGAQQFLEAIPFEVCITNLGIKEVADTGSIRPTALWGPITQNVSDDCTIGVVTHHGTLRMTAYGLELHPTLLNRIATKLVAVAAIQ